MKVNIIYTGMGLNNVLDRLARALADAGGYTYTKQPQKGFDLNHFICYVEYGERWSDWHETAVSCWFTHFDKGRQYKEFWWNLAAERCDLRITAARRYLGGLKQFGPAALARPALDPQFQIGGRKEQKKPAVGVAGYVHPQGRKGEKLVARLAGSDLGKRISLKGAGQGWPVPTVAHNWTDLPSFYNSLDAYLCTSTIEGVPMPPLEALACGVPVVIPRDVGMLDDLPEMAGIVRYAAGDYEGMVAALEKALEGGHSREALAEVVAPYNAQNWLLDHKRAFAEMKAGAKIESDRHGKRGVLYVAYGKPSRKCAVAAIASFREHMKDVEVALVSSEPLGVEDRFIPCNDVDIGGRYAKTRIYELAPHDWQYILYLDADTEIIADISFLYNVLNDGWDMAICKNPAKYHLAWQMKRSDNQDECGYTFQQLGTGELIQLNGGVFAFQRNARTQAFFEAWHNEWQRWGKRDQGALLRALFANPLKLYVLGNEWNSITRYMQAKDSAGILHYPMTARRWRGKVVQRSDSPEAWQAVRRWEAQQK